MGLHFNTPRPVLGCGVGVRHIAVRVCAVQPVLLEIDRELEWRRRRRWALRSKSSLLVVLLADAGIAIRCGPGVFARYRRVRSGDRAVPGKTRCPRNGFAPDRERRPHRSGRDIVRLSSISFIVLLILRVVGARAAKREEMAA